MIRSLAALVVIDFILIILGAVAEASCSGAQDKAQAQLAAIVGGCEVALELERDAGAAGAVGDTSRGCAAALHAWERAK